MSYPQPWLSRAEKLLMGVLLIAGVGVMLACGGGPVGPVPAVLLGYPRSPALDEVIQTHIDAGSDSREERILLTTWFQDGDPRVARFSSLRPDGRCSTYQYVHKTEFRSPTKSQLDSTTLRGVTAVIATLPPSQKPDLANMVILSFRQNGAWTTRVYDRLDRPAEVSTIFELTQSPIAP